MQKGNGLSCILCGNALEALSGDAHPDSGVACVTYGNYGSTVFDPCDGHYLAFVVCDECLVKAALEGRVRLGDKNEPLRQWVPDRE